jgi:SAM-dependent methyltransferase
LLLMNDNDSREDNEYVLGTDAAELERLGFQHRLWAAPTVALWERAGFGRGSRLLDIGSGPGYATMELAQLAGAGGAVTAVDISRRFLSHLQSLHPPPGAAPIRTLVGAADNMEVEDSSIDGAWARWVLCFTPDPAAVVREAARVLRPGGSLAILDYCRYTTFTVAPPSTAIDRVIAAADESFRRSGGSGDVGLSLPRILTDSGFDVAHIEPVVRLARSGSPLWKWPETFFRGYLATLLELELLHRSEADAFLTDWDARSRDPHAFFLTPSMLGIVATRR